VCANRIIVQEGIHDKFVELLARAVSKLQVGDGFDTGVNMGPLINAKAVSKVRILSLFTQWNMTFMEWEHVGAARVCSCLKD
jgi:delta 1-pyrroline-5-carboxylate dehydrogenase